MKSQFYPSSPSRYDGSILEQLWFKFKLKNIGGQYSPLDPTVVLKKYLRRYFARRILGEVEKEIEINLKVKSLFEGELCVDEFLSMFGSDVERCFFPFPFPLIDSVSKYSKKEEHANIIKSDGG